LLFTADHAVLENLWMNAIGRGANVGAAPDRILALQPTLCVE